MKVLVIVRLFSKLENKCAEIMIHWYNIPSVAAMLIPSTEKKSFINV
jgi:hypothetical protein